MVDVNQVKRLIYRSFIASIKAYQQLFLDLHIWGRKYIPAGPKIFVTNHITATDPYWVLPVFPKPIHVIIGPGYQSPVMRWVLDHFEQINAMPEFRNAAVDKAVEYLARGESVYTAPEGDLQPTFSLGRFYPGVARIYRKSRAPIIPIALFAPRSAMKEYPRLNLVVDGRVYRTIVVLRGPFCINIGEPFTPRIDETLDEDRDNQAILDELKERMRLLIEDIRINKFWL